MITRPLSANTGAQSAADTEFRLTHWVGCAEQPALERLPSAFADFTATRPTVGQRVGVGRHLVRDLGWIRHE